MRVPTSARLGSDSSESLKVMCASGCSKVSPRSSHSFESRELNNKTIYSGLPQNRCNKDLIFQVLKAINETLAGQVVARN